VGGTALSQVWLFIVAPLVGAIVAAVIHLVIADRSKDEIVVEPLKSEPASA
jgi:aquaporin Z